MSDDWASWSADIGKRLARLEKRHAAVVDALPEAMARTAAAVVTRRLTAGVWSATESYKAGSLVSHQGAAWVAVSDSTGARPGTAALAWRLAIKSNIAEVRKAVEAEVRRQHGR
jgi:hypothetical protein